MTAHIKSQFLGASHALTIQHDFSGATRSTVHDLANPAQAVENNATIGGNDFDQFNM